MAIAFALLSGLFSLKPGYDHGWPAGLCFFLVALAARALLSLIAEATVLRNIDPRLRGPYAAEIGFMLMVIAWAIGVAAVFVLWPEPPWWDR